MKDFNAVGHANNSFGFVTFGGSIPSTPNVGQFHMTHVQMTNVLGRGFSTSADAFGLVDHCYFVGRGTGSSQPCSVVGNRNSSWANSNPMGTTNAVYIEDCVFDNLGSGGNGFIDSYGGSQWCMRFNLFLHSAPSGVHGFDSQSASARTWEFYGNILTNWNSVQPLEMRGGTGIVCSNTVYGALDFCALAYYRACDFQHLGTVNALGYPSVNFYLQTNGTHIGTLTNTTACPTNTPIDGDVTIVGFLDSGRYLWKNTISAAGNVKIGASLAESLTNLVSAINKDPAGAGTKYWSTTVTNFDYRAVSTDGSHVILTCVRDGNPNPTLAYLANQQPGVIQSYPYTNLQVRLPAYSWSNINNGTNIGFSLKDNISQCSYAITNFVYPDRDFFNDTIAPGWTPLVYPHPLSSGIVPTPPTITSMTNVSISKNTSTPALPFTIGSGKTNVANYTMSASVTDAVLLPVANIVFGGSGTSRTATCTPASGQFGTVTVTIYVTDETGSRTGTSFLLTVADTPNSPPTITTIPNQTGTVNHAIGPVAFTIGDDITPPADLVVAATSSNQSLVSDGGLILTGSTASRFISLLPLSDGTATITVTVTDELFTTTSTNFNVTISGNSVSLSRPTSTQRYRN